jgi:hypothetical protein
VKLPLVPFVALVPLSAGRVPFFGKVPLVILAGLVALVQFYG